jgi:hypothetical protein
LREYGVQEDQGIKNIIKGVYKLELDGKLKTAEDEEAYLRKIKLDDN